MELDPTLTPGDYFGTEADNGSFLWKLGEGEAARVGVPNPDHRARATFSSGETPRDGLARVPMLRDRHFVIVRVELPPGAYYPRIARPDTANPKDALGSFPGYWQQPDHLVTSLNQLRAFVSMLDAITQTVHPVVENLGAFGGSIRNLLILACTECEAQWRGVLSANGAASKRPTTDHFVRLCEPMRLREYGVRFRHFPWLRAVRPFSGWDAAAPTRSLPWYDDYNAAKHDRESNFNKATLGTALSAVAAVWIMIAAQYGVHGTRTFPDLAEYFEFCDLPKWEFSEMYSYDHWSSDQDEGPRNYPF